MTIKFQQLVHALSLAQRGSFREAAEDQHLSQPAFSRSINKLEQTLGVSLFDRSTRGARPTLYGEAMLQRARMIVEQADELQRELHLLQGLDIGSFNVAMALVPAELSASRALGAMVLDYPNLEYGARLSDWDGVANLVLSRDVDIGIGEVSVAEQDDRLRADLVGEHDIVLFHRKGHPLSGKTRVTTSMIDEFNLALLKLPGRLADRFPGKGRIDPGTGFKIPSIEVDDFTIARNIVLESDAVSASMALQIEPWIRSGELEVLPFRAPWFKTRYGFITRRDRLLSPATNVFMDLVRRIELDIAARNRALMDELFAGK